MQGAYAVLSWDHRHRHRARAADDARRARWRLVVNGAVRSRPWICYWIVHALDLLDAFPTNYIPRIVGEWPPPPPHRAAVLASSYLALPALCDARTVALLSPDTLSRCQSAQGGFGGGPQQVRLRLGRASCVCVPSE